MDIPETLAAEQHGKITMVERWTSKGKGRGKENLTRRKLLEVMIPMHDDKGRD